LAPEDEGLAIPPMDVGALFLVSHATAMQNVSEVYISPTVTKTF
jgi:hypothetical protein